jgi:hypothetical protein
VGRRMKSLAIILLGLAASAFIIFGLTLAIPPTDDFDLNNPGWNGLSKFKSRVEPVAFLSLEEFSPIDSILFLIGPSKPFSETEALAIEAFLRRGGTVVLMDDYGSGNDLLAKLNVSARFANIEMRDPLFRGKDSRLIKIVEVKPYALNVSSLTLNCATVLVGVKESEVLARSSPFSYLDENGNGLPDEGEPKGPFPVMAKIKYGEGALILLSDSSLFINCMIDEDDNYALLRNLTAYKRVFIDASHWEPSKLTLFKAKLMKSYDLIKAGEVKYTLLASLAILTFKLKWRKEKEKSELKKVLKIHPDWNKELLRKLEEERLEGRKS